MRILRRPRTVLALALVVLACTGGTFTCHSDSGSISSSSTVN